MNPLDYYNTISLISISISTLVLLCVEIIAKGKNKLMFFSSFALLIVNLVITISCYNISGTAFNNMLLINKFSHLFTVLILMATLLTVLYSKNYIIKAGYDFGEFFILIFFSMIGMVLMVSANDLIIVFLGIELMSIPFYVLAGFFRKRIKSNESSL